MRVEGVCAGKCGSLSAMIDAMRVPTAQSYKTLQWACERDRRGRRSGKQAEVPFQANRQIWI